MTTLIACLFPVVINGHSALAMATGDLIKTTETSYVVDFSNATSDIEGISGDYSHVTVSKENCAVKEKK